MPLFLPSDADPFPTGELKKIVPAPAPAPDPKETWTEVKPGIYQNGLGQKKTGDMKPKWDESMQPAVYAGPLPMIKIYWVDGVISEVEMGEYSAKEWNDTLRAMKEISSWLFP